MTQIEFNRNIAHEIYMHMRKGSIKTVDGHEVTTLYTYMAKGERPIVGLVNVGAEELAMQWTIDGKRNPARLNTPSIYDLVLEVEES